MKRSIYHKHIFYFLYIVFFVSLTAHLFGQNVRELESQRKTIMEEIDLTSQLLNEIKSSVQTSLNRLNLLSAQVQSRKNVINLLNQEISAIDRDIAILTKELAEMEKDLKDIRDKYAASVQSMHTRNSSQYKWLYVLSADNFSRIVRRMRYIKEFADWQKRQGALILKKQEELNLKQQAMEQSRSEKVTLLSVREEENKKLEKEEVEQRAEVQQLNRRQSALQTTLDRQRQQAAELNRQIERLISNSSRNSLTLEEQKLSSDFSSNRGRLPFPVSGSYRIVRPFGEYQHPQLRNVRQRNDGIDIQATIGTDARSVFDGTVTNIFSMPGTAYSSVIVRHGNYLSVYTYLSEVYVKNGDKVSTTQRLGKIYTDTKNDNATILHFELRNEREKLNPTLWLNR